MKKTYKSIEITLIVDGINGAIDGRVIIPNATVVHGQEKGWVTVLGTELKYIINFKSEETAKEFKVELDEKAAVVEGNVFSLEYKYESEFQLTVEIDSIIKLQE